MNLSDFIKKTLIELNESHILGEIEFDLAIEAFNKGIYVLRDSDDNASRIRFTINIESKPTEGRP